MLYTSYCIQGLNNHEKREIRSNALNYANTFIFLISLETLLIARIIMMSDIKIGD